VQAANLPTLQYFAEEQDSLPLYVILKFQLDSTLTINQESIFLPLFNQAGLDTKSLDYITLEVLNCLDLDSHHHHHHNHSFSHLDHH